MKESKTWIKKLSKNTCVMYIPNSLVLDESFPFKIDDDKVEVLLKIDGDKLIAIKSKGENVNEKRL
jgi:hypothetical protein